MKKSKLKKLEQDHTAKWPKLGLQLHDFQVLDSLMLYICAVHIYTHRVYSQNVIVCFPYLTTFFHYSIKTVCSQNDSDKLLKIFCRKNLKASQLLTSDFSSLEIRRNLNVSSSTQLSRWLNQSFRDVPKGVEPNSKEQGWNLGPMT